MTDLVCSRCSLLGYRCLPFCYSLTWHWGSNFISLSYYHNIEVQVSLPRLSKNNIFCLKWLQFLVFCDLSLNFSQLIVIIFYVNHVKNLIGFCLVYVQSIVINKSICINLHQPNILISVLSLLFMVILWLPYLLCFWWYHLTPATLGLNYLCFI